MLGRLASGVAHDFNSILTNLIGMSEAMLARTELDPATMEDVLHIRSEAERGTALTRQILHFGRQDAQTPSVISLNARIASVSQLLRRLLPQNVKIDIDLADIPIFVRIDPVQLDQVIVNLATNARDAMPQGGALALHSRITTVARPAPAGGYVSALYAMMQVTDTGVGISSDTLPRIFDTHFTTRADSGGCGLGLSIVRDIVQVAGGWIEASSAPGRETCFSVYLPCVEFPGAEAPYAEAGHPVGS